MVSIPFALYDAYSDRPFCGSQAAVISEATTLSKSIRQQIAQEIAAPATAFITACSNQSISACFHSPKTEYAMCGHGTVSLMTRMVEQGVLNWDDDGQIKIKLNLPSAMSQVEIVRRKDGRPDVFLDIKPPRLSPFLADQLKLTKLLGLKPSEFQQNYPVEVATGDFVHLIVPLRDLKAVAAIKPDFNGLARFCQQQGLHTIAVFCTQVIHSDCQVHMRDLCPAVGVAESAGAGTTNAALTSYLIRHGLIQVTSKIRIQAEQGIELGRPGFIRSMALMDGAGLSRLQVGGVATKIIDGEICI